MPGSPGELMTRLANSGTKVRDSRLTHVFRPSNRPASRNSSKPSSTSKSTIPAAAKPALRASQANLEGEYP